MKRVLFVCTHNAGRSQMAEAFFNRDAPADVRARSAGQHPAPHIWPEVVQAMAEVGIDLSSKHPTRLLPEMQLHADWAITLACEADCPYVPTVVEDWDVEDPAGQSLEKVREIRDDIERRVDAFLELRLDEVRANRTSHQLHVAQLLPRLIERFPDKPEREIRACADIVLAEFEDASVRTYVSTLAERQAKKCLADGSCAHLVT